VAPSTDAAVAPRRSQHTVLQATKRRVRLSDIWTTRRVTAITALRDMRIKYKQSLLGPVWLVLQPLGLLAAMAVAFAGIAQVDTSGIPYALFALVGVTVWNYTQLTLAVATQAILANNTIVRRSAAPRLALIHGAMLSNGPTLVVMTVISTLIAVVWSGPRWQLLLVPCAVLWLLFLLWGPVLLFASISSRFRDVVAMVPLILQGGTFISPVGYPVDSAPPALETILWINPLTGMIEAWRWAILGSDPAITAIIIAAAWTVALAIVGWRVFARLETTMADFL